MIVVDTNVVLAGLVSSLGFSFRLLEKMLTGKIDYLVNVPLFSEYRSVIMREEHLLKIPLSLKDIEMTLALIAQHATFQQVYYKWRPNLFDEGDNFIVELAIAGDAESIVTFNRADFVSAELKFDFKIETPKEFLKRKNLYASI